MSDWKSILDSVAPTIAAGMGGPLAGMVTKFVADKYLGNSSAPTEQVQQAIANATPEQVLQLKQVEEDFKKFMVDNDLKRDQLIYQDRADARNMAVKTGIRTQQVMTGYVMVGYTIALVGLLAGIFKLPADEATKAVLITALTLLFNEFKTSFSFWMGTSLGSKTKEDAITGASK